MRRKSNDEILDELKVRPQKVRLALQWLKRNNHLYQDIEISEDNLAVYEKDDNGGTYEDLSDSDGNLRVQTNFL